jgi:hypothetical protein
MSEPLITLIFMIYADEFKSQSISAITKINGSDNDRTNTQNHHAE